MTDRTTDNATDASLAAQAEALAQEIVVKAIQDDADDVVAWAKRLKADILAALRRVQTETPHAEQCVCGSTEFATGPDGRHCHECGRPVEARRSEPDRPRRSAGPQADPQQAMTQDFHQLCARVADTLNMPDDSTLDLHAVRVMDELNTLRVKVATVRRDTLREAQSFVDSLLLSISAAHLTDAQAEILRPAVVSAEVWLRQRAEDGP